MDTESPPTWREDLQAAAPRVDVGGAVWLGWGAAVILLTWLAHNGPDWREG